jgi:propionate CoA-transferase
VIAGNDLAITIKHLVYITVAVVSKGRKVLYITERAVFQLIDKGLELIEIAPGIDVEKDILAQMGFVPHVSDELKSMSMEIFTRQ